MRALLIGALAATLVGCSCLYRRKRASKHARTRTGSPVSTERLPVRRLNQSQRHSRPIPRQQKSSPRSRRRPKSRRLLTPAIGPISPTAKSTMIAAKVEPPASRIPLPPRSLKTRLQPASNAAAGSDTTRANIAASHPTGGAVANSNTGTIQEQVAAATAIAERMTVHPEVPAPEPTANNRDRSNHSEIVVRGDAEKTAPASPNEPAAGSAQNQPVDTAWVVSETTSPVDYSPLITAVIHSTSSVKDAPNTLAVRCRGLRTELLLRTEGVWRASRASEVQVDYQINDQPFVRLPWTVSADGKTASYKDDPVGLLQSLPEGARLKISVFDRQGLGQEATFQLTGLDSVRKKIGLVCKWPPTADIMALRKR